MIMARNEDGTYSQVGFVKDSSGIDTEYIYDKDGDIVFEKGFTRETSDIVPLTINGIGKDLKDWSITGNTVQDGTPTPDSPIMPQGTGERTANLCPDTPYKTGYSINANGVETNSPQFSIYCIPAEPETEYALSLKEHIGGTTVCVHAYKNGEWQAQLKTSPIQDLPLKFTTITNCDELRLSIVTIAVPMLNSGSTALPYEPYGYKIPVVTRGKNYWKTFSSKISSGVTITHDGEKYLFSGICNESINVVLNVELNAGTYFLQANANRIPIENAYSCIDVWMPSLNKLYSIKNNVATYGTLTFSVDAPVKSSLRIRLEKGINYDDFELKPMLGLGTEATQYEPYHEPVTTPIYLPTPLYSGEVMRSDGTITRSDGTTETFTAPQIPTLNDTTVIDVDTKVEPSDMYIKYKSSK